MAIPGLPRAVVTAPNLLEFRKGLDNGLRHVVGLLGWSWAELEAGLNDLGGSLPAQDILRFYKSTCRAVITLCSPCHKHLGLLGPELEAAHF